MLHACCRLLIYSGIPKIISTLHILFHILKKKMSPYTLEEPSYLYDLLDTLQMTLFDPYLPFSTLIDPY